MKVYVVVRFEWEPSGWFEIVDVFASIRAAKAVIPKGYFAVGKHHYESDDSPTLYVIDTMDLQHRTRNPLHDLAFKILDGDPQAIDAAKDILARGGIEA